MPVSAGSRTYFGSVEQPRTRTPNTSRAPGGRPRLPRPAGRAVARGDRRGDRRDDRDRKPPRGAPAADPRAAAVTGAAGAGYRERRPGPLPGAVRGALGGARGPGARLTGFGTGVLITLLTLLGGYLDTALFGADGDCLGLVFVAASVAGAFWVRQADLAAAPVSAPIAFALALALTGPGIGGGFLGNVMGTVTALATHTGWLYSGTLLAAVVAIARRVVPARLRMRRR